MFGVCCVTPYYGRLLRGMEVVAVERDLVTTLLVGFDRMEMSGTRRMSWALEP